MTDIFELSDHAVEALADANPMMATAIGIAGRDHRWPDLSPAGHESRDALARSLRDRAEATDVDSAHAELAKRVMIDDLGERILRHESGDHFRDLNNISSPFQAIKSTIDLMPHDDLDQWSRLLVRLETIAQPLEGYRECLAEGLASGMAVAQRQVLAVIEEGRLTAGDESPLRRLMDAFDELGIADDGLRTRIERAVVGARAAYGTLTEWLADTYLPAAAETDGVGEERYVLEARKHLGMTIDIHETYAWGWSEVARLWNRLETVCAQIDPSRDVHGVVDMLSSDPEHAAGDTAEFVAQMQAVQEEALAQLDGTHFDVPEQIRRIEVRVSPPGGALAPYYSAPSEDFSRPGAVWYPLGERTVFPLWRELTTAYHEGFPGHHLQVGVQSTLGEQISRYHRLAVWQPGSGEGWALYAEHLMGELGYLDEPMYEVGGLAAQLLRACRVVADIGMHCDLKIPDDAAFHPGERWSFDLAVEMMQHVALQDHDVAVSEVTRYLGWPGQAISYKVGERVILDLRAELMSRPGFDLKDFHAKVLGVGSIGLDLLQDLVRAA